VSRLRIRFDKRGKVRFTSHRDVARIWERALRRAGVPVAYSEGFSPRPRLSFGLALSTGYTSDAEYLDVHLSADARAASFSDAAGLASVLSEHLPVGMSVIAVREVDSGLPSLQQAVTSCTWRIDVSAADAAAVEEAVRVAWESEELIVTRTRKSRQVVDDIRPLVISLEVEAAAAGVSEAAATGAERAAEEAAGEGFATGTDENALAGAERAATGVGEGAGAIAGGKAVASGPIHDRNGSCVRVIAELGTQPRAVRVPELLAALDPAVSERHVHRTHQWILTHDGLRTDPMSVDVPSPAASGAK